MNDEYVESAKNMFGALKPETKQRLEAVLDHPSSKTWEDAYSIVVNSKWVGSEQGGYPRDLTLWQAVIAVDPSYARIGKSTDIHGNVVKDWAKIPDRLTLYRALRYASTNEVTAGRGELPAEAWGMFRRGPRLRAHRKDRTRV